ncbi:response regulator transcription factor [Streptacidiphilus sp. PB12-B1b]|uniref:helix-turn-helix transcriptional regulator n=1 Tax=Streptacidiphilus sp. PB12-B1b TaxID=2705012 RepID=UPI0015F89484|nr:response regulator transcription factor [Streptacidiphilus sp. PB12-B1b]QMU77658.1 response regulator transcription factor [Streptacidiphilus sp. PB12-B1b]
MHQAVDQRVETFRLDHGPRIGAVGRSAARVVVEIHATDPISRAGAAHHLCQYPGITLSDEERPDSVSVAVVIAETVDDSVLQTLRRLTRGGLGNVVLVVARMREFQLLEVVECGVGTILWRHEADAARLLQGVLAAARGDGNLPTDLLGRLLTQVGRMQRSAAEGTAVPVGLSERETDVLRLVADGLDTSEIAARLSYSERTVKNVLHGLTSRLHLRNRAHAVAYALREGYI